MAILRINNQLNMNYVHLSTMKKKNILNATYSALSSITENMELSKSTMAALGLAGYDVTGGFGIRNLMEFICRIDYMDVPRYMLDMNKNQILNVYRMFVQSVMKGQATKGISILSGIIPDGWRI